MKRFLMGLVTLLLLLPAHAPAQEKKKAKAPAGRPAVVVLDKIQSGAFQPMADFIGTVYFSRVSSVAAEADGRVESVDFEEGRRVKKGRVLVAMNTDLLDLGIRQKQALYEEARVELDQTRKDLARMEKLYQEKSVAYTVFDDTRFKTLRLEKKARALEAALNRDRVLKKKMTVRAPFDGLVLEKQVEVGEWVGPGSLVAVVAADREVDVVVEVPEKILRFLQAGADISLTAGGRALTGRFDTVIPKGDTATRTFSVKIRLANDAGLIEGMEARTLLPTGKRIEGLLVSRDAVVSQFGMEVIFISVEGAAKMVPVKVLGYLGMQVGIAGPGLSAGMPVVVKGNERIRNGQPLVPQAAAPARAPEKPGAEAESS